MKNGPRTTGAVLASRYVLTERGEAAVAGEDTRNWWACICGDWHRIVRPCSTFGDDR